MSMITRKRLLVTLLEMLIVMAILAAVAGIVAIGIHKALVSQRFQTEVSLVLDEVRRAQDLMMILGADVHVKFTESEKEKAIDFWLEMETRLAEGIQKEVVKNVRQLRTIRGVFFRDKTQNIEGLIDLKFFSKGAVMSQGVLQLSLTEDEHQTENTLTSYICLSGYPQPIISTDDKEYAEKICHPEQDEVNQAALTKDTLERLPEKVKQPPEKENTPPTTENKPQEAKKGPPTKEQGK